ncbi:hypothetical protein [Haloquadratum walsbyi]|jgi:hypothetical protein|uniref:Uncharacterized protein n=1 Tax=Haloquadratum walsbyi J07HQW2 TaxID=1238425 RepID=U1PP07_9EURY|nr:hypothetical protein [Haloquadratum walsbyi]ERG95467.1 MAG: hypothetical protein J07HQW2_01924 [Haloquadratum walsbyi J07HQW2]
MGLTCRFLGHTFGDPEIEHTREERGNEVVATVRKTQTCNRCNIEQIISQNKEVTAIRPTETDEIDTSDGGETNTSSSGWESAPDRAHVRVDDSMDTSQDDSPVDDAVILDNGETEHDETQWPADTEISARADAEESTTVEQDGESSPEQYTDTGAEILDPNTTGETATTSNTDTMQETSTKEDMTTSSGRTRKEWSTSERNTLDAESQTAPEPWPDLPGEDEGYTAQPDADRVSIEFGGEGLTPQVESRSAESESKQIETDLSARDDTKPRSFTHVSETSRPESTVPDSRVELYCPHCEHSHPADISSMRAGDICPECQNEYINERER